MQREFFFDTDWPWWVFAVAGTVAMVVVLRLYRHERREAGGVRGAVLTLLRLALVALVLLMFGQPVMRIWQTRQEQRRIAIFVDDSASMQIPDAQASPAERLRWADAVGLLAHDDREIRPELLSAQLAMTAQTADLLARQINEVQLYHKRQVPVPAALVDAMPASVATLASGHDRLGPLWAPLLNWDSTLPAKAPAAGLPDAAMTQWLELRAAVKDDLKVRLGDLVRSLADRKDWLKLDDKELADTAMDVAEAAKRCRAASGLLDARLDVRGMAAGDPGSATLSWLIDAAAAARLGAEKRAAVEEVGRAARANLAMRLLSKRGGQLASDAATSSAGAKGDRFAVDVYRFARTCSDLPESTIDESANDPQAGSAGGGASGGATTQPNRLGGFSRTAEDSEYYTTDLGNAINQVLTGGGGSGGGQGSGGSGGTLAGIVVLTDGRFNGPGDPAGGSLAREGSRRVPIVPICIGSRLPPVDLAVMKVNAPQSLFKDDSATVTAVVKMDGLAGRFVEVQLLSSESPQPLETRRLRADSSSQRRQVEFPLKPGRAEATTYTVRARIVGGSGIAGQPNASVPMDVMPDNDAMTFNVNVTEDTTKVLTIDGPPRWEFEFLRNLLLRDKGILAQHLLFAPAWVQPQTPPLPVASPVGQPGAGVAQPVGYSRVPAGPVRTERHASVRDALAKGIAEVTALPKSIGELSAFDVVVLGDVSPKDLPEEQQRNLERFVSERGGTLILIAGKENMPEKYDGLPLGLGGLLPVKFNPVDSLTAQKSLEPYRLRLTDEGQRSEMMRLTMEGSTDGSPAAAAGRTAAQRPLDTQSIWDKLPPCGWRCASVTAKPGATVLAYAEPVKPEHPGPGVGGPGAALSASPDPAPADSPLKREEIARQRPLIVLQNYGVGHVMFLAFDSTWRLRYKVGDKYHHKLWGQVMRWATAGRLTGKSPYMKIGTGRASYRLGEEISIKARVSNQDYEPVKDAELVAMIRRNGEEVRQVNLLPAQAVEPNPSSQPDGAISATTRPDGDRAASEGMFVGTTAPLPAGAYEVVLLAKKVPGLPEELRKDTVRASLFVVDNDPVEIQELSARPPTELAEGGLVLSPSTATLVQQMFGPPVLRDSEHTDLTLWSSWQLLVAFALIASIEWILRKRSGLI